MMPGRTITPADIPPSIKDKSASPNLPAQVLPPGGGIDQDGGSRPAIEFIFRMLLQLRMDVEDLKKGFDEYRENHPAEPGPIRLPYPYTETAAGRDVSSALPPYLQEGPDFDDEEDEELDEERTVVYRPGMTMKELEREAITAALKEVGGNRREAAEALGIGERTLYRKIKEYDVPL
jgi:DNA-binding NtrC family response regulator